MTLEPLLYIGQTVPWNTSSEFSVWGAGFKARGSKLGHLVAKEFMNMTRTLPSVAHNGPFTFTYVHSLAQNGPCTYVVHLLA